MCIYNIYAYSATKQHDDRAELLFNKIPKCYPTMIVYPLWKNYLQHKWCRTSFTKWYVKSLTNSLLISMYPPTPSTSHPLWTLPLLILQYVPVSTVGCLAGSLDKAGQEVPNNEAYPVCPLNSQGVWEMRCPCPCCTLASTSRDAILRWAALAHACKIGGYRKAPTIILISFFMINFCIVLLIHPPRRVWVSGSNPRYAAAVHAVYWES